MGGACLALPGEAYAFYVEDSRITVNLEQLENPERAAAEWIDTWTGARQTAGPVRAGVMLRMTKPQSFGKAPAVLVVNGAR